MPVRTRLALLAPVTPTPAGVLLNERVPCSTVRVMLRLRSATLGSRSASTSATLMPPMARGMSSWPFWVPGRAFTGASFCST
ncbi:hypothetical protein D9M71_229060 [compost metagenome]